MNQIYQNILLELPKGKHLTAEVHTANFNLPPHWHTYFEIEIILAGKGRCFLNDNEYDLEQTRFFLLTPTDFHHYEINGPVSILNVSFDGSVCSEEDLSLLIFSGVQRAITESEEEHRRTVSAARLLQNEYETAGDCQKKLLSYLLHRIFRASGPLTHKPIEAGGFPEIGQALTYMHTHFKENITLPAISAMFGYHPTYFSELFHRATGSTFLETLTSMRMSHAASLLESGFRVADTCHLAGFGSISNFTELFKRRYGETPSAYRAARADRTLKLSDFEDKK